MDDIDRKVSQRRRRKLPGQIPLRVDTSNMTEEQRAHYFREKRLDTPVAEVFSHRVRAVNMLEIAGIITMRDLLARNLEQLLALPNFASKTFHDIVEGVVALGLEPPWDTSPSVVEQTLRQIKRK